MRLVLLALVLSGCAPDPCDGVSGTCLSARVEGAVSALDQLRITVDGVGKMSSPSSPGDTFSPPVRLAIALPQQVGASALITIDGLLSGSQVASSGAQTVPLAANGRAVYTFTLMAGIGGDGGGSDGSGSDGGSDLSSDDGGNADLAGVVSVSPSSNTIPDVPRNGTSGKVTFTITNNTSSVRTATTVNHSLANAPFQPDPSSTCPLNAMGLGTLPARSSCTLILAMKTRMSGSYTDHVTVTLDDGETLAFTVMGKVTPTWTIEVAGSGQTQLMAVWGSSPTDVYAVGSDPTWPVLHSAGTGQWMPYGNGLGVRMLYSIAGADPQHVWTGSDAGMILSSVGGPNWIPDGSSGLNGRVTGIWAASPNLAWAVTDVGNVAMVDPSGTNWASQTTLNPLYAVHGSAGIPYVAGSGGLLGTVQNGVFQGIPTGTSTTFHAVWQAPPTTAQPRGDVWAAGNPVAASMPPVIVHLHTVTGTVTMESPGNSLGVILGISGRLDPLTGMLDIWMVGSLNELLHSDGSGTWTPVPAPTTMALSNVFVFPTGEAYAAGQGGQVLHLY